MDWSRLEISVCRRFANILFKGVVVQCAELIEFTLSMTKTTIVSVTKMKAMNLSKGRSMFFPITLMEQSYNAQKNKKLHYDEEVILYFLLRKILKMFLSSCVKVQINIKREGRNSA